ncbi:acyltransferase-like protein, chloroplastic isoform X1 [Iris pallida]|uniref:Acyltransferase-like protein, chloroplastic isoform X1 n=1 Tax=Iris pallida TaxID=29817 RepID=A0AAX6HUK1_IRIPA|nr:acyltransferase-like protein, chloroplastic isoform X1 [Iris pallida]
MATAVPYLAPLLPPAAACRLRRNRIRLSAVGTRKLLDDSEVEPRGVADFAERSRDLAARTVGGPVRWFAPVECGPPAVESPPSLFFLPGLDGVGFGLIRHHQRLGKIFDVWCLHIPVTDQTPFVGLVEYVERTVKSEQSYSPNKPIYLVGESIGACVALAVAARNPNVDFILILANPATSFLHSQLQTLSVLLDVVPVPFQVMLPNCLSLLTGASGEDEVSQRAIRVFREDHAHIFPPFSFLADLLPKEYLDWKLEMLRSASLFVNSRLHAVRAQTLLLASGMDQLLPSREEAERLHKSLPNCRIRHFNDSGHTIFLEDGIDLVTTIKGATCYRRSSQIDYVSDYLLPTPSEFQKAADQYKWVDLAASPVMFSTLKDGKIVKGLEGIPTEGPAVFVGYHMLMGWELGHLVSRLFTERNIHLRGIAHPFMFDRDIELIMPDSSSFDGIRLMGAVPTSPANFYKLLLRKSSVLLYPGGTREALHRKDEEYKLFWPEKPEFVRMASRFGAQIIPFAVVGEDDLFKVVIDLDDLVNVPFYNLLHKRLNPDSVKLRTDYTGEVANQDMHPLGLLPKIPGRLYFLFGKPIDTQGRKEELRDKERAQQLYLHVKSEVENCIAYLKKKREKDPYRNILPRLLYQATRGFSAEVPTFEL